MSYVKQICDGYNKKSLMGNWYQERIYPLQGFRQQQAKKARQKDNQIMCFNNQGIERGLPRLQRRTKWETTGRIVLDDHYYSKQNETHSAYPYHTLVTSKRQMKRVFDRTSDSVDPTPLHPHSQIKTKQKKYHFINHTNFHLINAQNNQNLGDIKQLSTNSIIQDNKVYHNTTYQTSYSSNKINPQYNISENLKKAEQDQKNKQIQSGIIKNDIQTSLNLNVGLHKIHPKFPEDGRFRHIRKDVTINHHY